MSNTLLGIVAGETSGDLLAANLIQALTTKYATLKFAGIGGPEMQAHGCEALYDMEQLSVVGITEILRRLPHLFKLKRQLVNDFLAREIKAFIGVDAPEFNLRLAYDLHRAGIPTIHYVSPTVWAWREYRLKYIAKAVDLMLTLYPFESAYYEKYNIPHCYVGHPLAQQIALNTDLQAARKQLKLPKNKTIIAVLPGSRYSEVLSLSISFIKTMLWCLERNSDLHFIVPMANSARYQQFKEILAEEVDKPLPITVILRQAQTAMAAADVILLASGTATLEATLLKKPMVVAYKVSPVTAWIVRRLLTIKYIAQPNILSGEALVPEFLQQQVKPEILGQALFNWLDNPEAVKQLQQRFHDIHHDLLQGGSTKAADAIGELLTARDIKLTE
ncbi:MAG: lipid-A-disaccharide synthase [Gammaproteobacteria bacterium]